MLALGDKFNEKMRKYRVMAKTLQQARFEKIWEPHGTRFGSPLPSLHAFALVGDVSSGFMEEKQYDLAAALDVAAFSIPTTNSISLAREMSLTSKLGLMSRLYPSLSVKHVREDELFAAIGFPSSKASLDGKHLAMAKSEDELKAVRLSLISLTS